MNLLCLCILLYLLFVYLKEFKDKEISEFNIPYSLVICCFIIRFIKLATVLLLLQNNHKVNIIDLLRYPNFVLKIQ